MQKGAAKMRRKKNSNGKENMRPVSDFKFNTRFYNILMKVDLNVEKKTSHSGIDGTKAQQSKSFRRQYSINQTA